MKALLIVLVVLLSGCVSATYRNGTGQSVTYNDLFKKASDVKVVWGPVEIEIGNMSSELTTADIVTYLKVMGAIAPPNN